MNPAGLAALLTHAEADHRAQGLELLRLLSPVEAGVALRRARHLVKLDLSGLDLSGADLRKLVVGRDCRLDGANLSGANLQGAVLDLLLVDVTFQDADLRHSLLGALERVDLRGAQLHNVNVRGRCVAVRWGEGNVPALYPKERCGGCGASGADPCFDPETGATLATRHPQRWGPHDFRRQGRGVVCRVCGRAWSRPPTGSLGRVCPRAPLFAGWEAATQAGYISETKAMREHGILPAVIPVVPHAWVDTLLPDRYGVYRLADLQQAMAELEHFPLAFPA